MEKQTIYGRFRRQVEAAPDRVAVITDSEEVSFGRLDRMADCIAAALTARPGDMVGIVMEHGPWQIAAMLGVLKCGAVYVPAEPSLPRARRDFMMEMAGVRVVVDDAFVANLDVPTDKTQPDLSEPDGVAYVLFTSGTSGRPKGVVVENRSVVNYAEAFEAETAVAPGDVMLQYSVCSFDIFVEEVFASLLNGVALAIPSRAVHDGPLEGLMDFCRHTGVTILDGFPYFVADINRRPELVPESVRLIISGGDVVRDVYISNLRDRGIRIYNTYGPSETTVCSNYYRIDNAEALPDGTFPVGKAVKGVRVAVLDEDLRPVPRG